MYGTASASVGAPLGPLADIRCGSPVEAARQVERYELQSVARLALPQQRVAFCHRHMVEGASRVMVNYSEERKRARYGNLQTCGSPWVCPVCASVITERRRAELRQAIDAFADRGPVLMSTYTFQHHKSQALVTNLAAMSGAWERMRNRKGYQRLRAEFCVPYVVRAVEATYSQGDGWHPHMHQLLFVDADVVPIGDVGALAAELEERLYRLWSRSCETKGLSMSRAHGVRVDTGAGKVAEYVAKFGVEPQPKRWTAAEEMTRGHMKHGHDAGDGDRHMTPFDLLRWARDGGEEEPVKQFRAYARAFMGKHQLSWTPKMRTDLGLGVEETDEEIAARQDPGYVLLAEIEVDEWEVIKRKDLRAEALRVAGAGDRGVFFAWLDGVMWGER